MTSVSSDRRQGLNSSAAMKVPCRVATSANIILAGEQTIDGVACVTGDRVLLIGQTDGTQNGIWDVDTGNWTRSLDADGHYDLLKGSQLIITDGTQKNAVYRLDTNNPITIGTTVLTFTAGGPASATAINNTRGAAHAVVTTLHDWIEAQPLDAPSFGILASGADMTTAIKNAITDLKTAGGGEILLPRGTIVLNGAAPSGADGLANGIEVPYTAYFSTVANRVLLRGHGKSTVLKAGAANMFIIRWSDCFGGIEDLTLDGNNIAGTCGLGLVPFDVTAVAAAYAAAVFQAFNNFKNVEIRNCAEGLMLQSAPTVGGADSECRDNRFYDLNIMSCVRARWLRNSAASGAGCNRNKFYGGRNGQTLCNTGYQIDAGSQNEDHGVDYEGIVDVNGGVPNATPTGLKIAASSAWGADNNNNKFFGGMFETAGVTRHIDNANAYTEFHGLTYDGTKVLFTAVPLVSIGGNGASATPQIMPGYISQAFPSMVPGYGAGTFMTQSNLEHTPFDGLDNFDVGTIANTGGTKATTILQPRTQQTVTFEATYTMRHLGGAPIVYKVRGIAAWGGGNALQQYGAAEVSEDTSLGANDWRVNAELTVAISASANAVVLTVTNGAASDMIGTKCSVRWWLSGATP